VQLPSSLPVTNIEIIRIEQNWGKQLIVLLSTSETLYSMTGSEDLVTLLRINKANP
jgi:hypothetical protein